MSTREDRNIIFRNLKHRMAETMLLIIGLALGIGASAAGIALVLRSMEVSRELLTSQQYREITVSTRQSTGDMDVPIMVLENDQSVTLTSLDLQAASDAPDIAYGYIKQPTTFRSTAAFVEAFTSAIRGQSGISGQSGEGGGGIHRETESDSGALSERLKDAPDLREAEPLFTLPEHTLDGPEPALDEWHGYLVTPQFFTAWGLQASRGSLLTLEDVTLTSNVMVLGSELAKILYDDGFSLGRRFISGPTVYEIIGILEPTGTPMDDMAFSAAFMPDILQNIQLSNISMIQSRWNTNLSFMVNDPAHLERAAEQLDLYFSRTYGPGSAIITIPRLEAQAIQDRNTRIVTMILFLALAGLFIAGVNVSNILLGRTLRKQKTIGVLKALGASKKKIFSLFFREALVIGLFSTVIGIGISYVLAHLMQQSTELGPINPYLLAAGIGTAWVITTVLTIFPALHAAKIPAAEAMRTE